MPVSDPALAGQVFGKVPLAGCTDVADVSERTCEKFGLGAGALTRCRLYLIAAPDGVDEPTAVAIKDALSGERLQSSWPLERARIGPGSWLLARVPPTPVGDAPVGDVYLDLKSILHELPSRMLALMRAGNGDASPSSPAQRAQGVLAKLEQ
jgi:hypothetical protein